MISIKTRRKAVLFLAGMLAIHAFVCWRARRWVANGSPDFTSMYTAGRMVRQGMSHQIYDEQVEWQVQSTFSRTAVTRGKSWPYVHAPFEALLFVPFSVDSYLAAYFLWAEANVAMLVLLYALLKPHMTFVQQHSMAFWMFLLLAYFPVYFTILEGQDNILLLVLYILAFLCMKKNSWFAAGCWLAFGLFRLHLVLPFVAILFLLRKWKFLAGFAVGGAVTVFASALVVGWRGVWQYPQYIWYLEQHRGKTEILTPAANCNLRGLIEGSLGRWLQPSVIIALIVLVSVVAIWFAAKTWKSIPEEDSRRWELAFSVSLLITVLVSFHGFMYDLALLILPVVIILNQFLQSDSKKWEEINLFVPMVILFFTPAYLLFSRTKLHHNAMALVLLWWTWAIMRKASRPDYPSQQVSLEAQAHA